MPKPEYYPINREEAAIYNPVFSGEHWQGAPSMPLPARAKDETMTSAVAIGLDYDIGVKICKLAEIGEEGVVLAEGQSQGSLLKSTYEALLVRRRKGREFSETLGDYSAAELPLGFSVRYNSRGYQATYIQRTIGHLVMVDKHGSKVFRRVLPKMDFTDGSIVDEEVLDSNPFESFRTFKYPSLTMGPSRLSRWRLGTVFEEYSEAGLSTIEQKMRVARTEVFVPQQQGGTRRRRTIRTLKTAELRLHT
jgi:hypothetical protein